MRTDARRKSEWRKESAWGLTSAPCKRFRGGDLLQRGMRGIGLFRHGSRLKRLFDCSRQWFIEGVAFSGMAYEFAENEFELEPESSSARGGGPPRKNTAAGVLDLPLQSGRRGRFLQRVHRWSLASWRGCFS